MIAAGDLFAIPLAGAGFVTGHVVLNVESKTTERLVPNRSRLLEHGSLLLDVYGPAMPVPSATAPNILIRGIWTDDGKLVGRERWARIGRREIDPECVEFPEYVLDVDGVATFERGEIQVPVPALSHQIERIKTRQPFVLLGQLRKICTNLAGQRELLGAESILFELDSAIDLRYSPHRDEVYRALGADPARSYWRWASSDGLDPGRLWR